MKVSPEKINETERNRGVTSSECVRVMFMVADILLDHLFVKSKYLHLVSSCMSHLKVSRHFRAMSLHSSLYKHYNTNIIPNPSQFSPN